MDDCSAQPDAARAEQLTCPDHFVLQLEHVYAATLHAGAAAEGNRQQVLRDRAAMLVGKIVEEDHVYDCSNKATRERILELAFLMRSDQDLPSSGMPTAPGQALGAPRGCTNR